MIYVFLADGFEETEAITVIDVLRRANLQVTTVAVGTKDALVAGAHGINVQADATESMVTVDDMKAVVLPGGMPGTINLEQSPIVRASVFDCAEKGNLICAICAAPSVLGHLGLLKGKKATCYPGFEQELLGAEATGNRTEQDGNIITANGPGAAAEFAFRIAAALAGEETAQKVREGMQCS